jgi:hypothetical protein
MMKMSRSQTRFYLARLLLFYKPAQIGRLLGVTRPTIDRYIDGENTPSVSKLPVFQSALQELIKHLDEHHKKWGFGRSVADLIDDEIPPRYLSPAIPTKLENVMSFLIDQLKKPRKLNEIMDAARELEFTRAQVHRAADALKVIKQPHGTGRTAYSVWRLP